MSNKKQKYILLGIVGFIILAESILTGLLPHSRGYLYELLEVKEGPIYFILLIFFLNYLFLEFFQAIKAYWVLKLALFKRKLRTKLVTKRHVPKKGQITNTPQRIQEDIKLSYFMRLTVVCEYLISGIILIQLVILNYDIPLLLVGALVYAALSVLIAILFNPRLKKAEIEEQHHEADFRQKLMSKLNPMGLANANKASLWAGKVRMHYLLFTKIQLAVLQALPYLILIPILFAGDMTLGEVVKHSVTFQLIVINAAILITFYTQWVKGTASEKRVRQVEKNNKKVLDKN